MNCESSLRKGSTCEMLSVTCDEGSSNGFEQWAVSYSLKLDPLPAVVQEMDILKY